MQTQPVDPFYVGQTGYQLCQTASGTWQICAVGRQILCYHIEFPYSTPCEHSDLRFDFLNPAGAMPSCNQRDGTECAEPVASFGDLEISMMRGSGHFTVIHFRD